MAAPQPIKIAVLAMGGEGGGVLADWIVDLGEHNGYLAQNTSVPGVAQRTGATIYYIELFPLEQARQDGATPVLALMPLPGDVDVVLASELMEAGRAVQRGLVTPDRTTLIASTHRVYAISEKTAMGDGRVDDAELLKHAEAAAKRFVRFDMAAAAQASLSVISAVLFGALAGTGVLPFSRVQFESTIERGGVGVGPSLKAFAAAFSQAAGAGSDTAGGPDAAPPAAPPAAMPRDPRVRSLLARVRGEFPAESHAMLTEGVRRTLDFQDPAYAGSYLDRMGVLSTKPGGCDITLLNDSARHLALWMTYEDTIRVAQLKTRASRFERVHGEARVKDNQVLAINEYMHPRLQEICETLPAALGRRLLASGWPRRLAERMTRHGRVITTTSLRGFLMLRAVAAMKRWRPSSLRFQQENALIDQWLRLVAGAAATNPHLAIEVARCARLVKGYGETRERGLRNYETLIAVVQREGSGLAAATLRDLRDAALADERGDTLRALLTRHALA